MGYLLKPKTEKTGKRKKISRLFPNSCLSSVVLFTALAIPVYTQPSVPPPAKAEPVRIYLGNDDHTDYMWTTDADTYNAVFVDMLDYYLKLTDDTTKNPAPYQSRFNTDGSYWLWQYERQKTPAEFDRLMKRVKDGHISAPLNTLVSCYGAQPMEAVLRGMYYAGRLERRYNLRFPLAMSMENQTQPLGLASLWAGAGARYSWKGVCGCASQIPNASLFQRDHEIYWYTGPDGQRVLMKWFSLGPKGLGSYTEASSQEFAINYLQSDEGFLKRYTDAKNGAPYSVRGAFGFGGDSVARKTGAPADPGVPKEPGVQQGVIGWPYTDHFHNIAKKETNKRRQVIVSNTQDFFEDFEKRYGANLPAESVTYGNEWDLYSASMAETSARVRRSVEKLRAAELMSTLVSLEKPAFFQGREKARDRAFTNLGLYWEHDWTADGPISRKRRAAWQEMLATEIEGYVDTLHADAAGRLGYLIQKPREANRFFVLNPLGGVRSDFADFTYTGSTNIHVRDVMTGKDVPHQMIKQDGISFLRILASDIPSAGYKTFDILSGPGTAPLGDAVAVSGTGSHTLENAFVKLIVDPDGAIRSFVDKKRGNAELAATIGNLKINDLAPGDESGTITLENRGPVSVTLRCTSSAGVPHMTFITMYRDSDRVDIRNQITANFSDVRYWSFGFNLASPSVHTEEVGAINRNRLKSQGGDYADTHARYDHVTLNHFADITDGAGKRGVTLSNADCSFAKLGGSSIKVLDITSPQINVLAGGQVDGPSLGIRGQNGATEFLQRFALQPHGAYDAPAAMRFALQHQNPLVTGGIAGTEICPYPADKYSLLTISDPDVLLWSVKPAEEGIDTGIIARVWNLGAAPNTYSAVLTGGLSNAWRATHIETDIEPLPVAGNQVKATVARSQIQTLRLLRPSPPYPPIPLPPK